MCTPSALPPTPDFRALFESAPGLYLVLTPDFTIVGVSDAYLRATMTRREDILGRGLFEVFPDNPDDPGATGVANLRASLTRVLAQGRPDAMAVQKYDIRRPESEGGGFEERHWSPVNSPVFGSDGEMAYIIHRVEDVTEFVRLKEQGTEQHRVAEELRSRADVMEAEIYRRAQEIQEANRQLRDLQAELEHRVEARTADLVRTNQELQQEIAERRRAEEALRRSEERLRQSQKLEAVGRLAGGVAHDFNNLLSVILSYAELLLRRLEPAERFRDELSEIQCAGRRAADLTRQLLAFSRQQVLDPTILDVNEVIAGVSGMLARLLGEDIDLELLRSPCPAKVRADRGQLEQVLLNLVVNARDAMPDGGKLTIETARVELDETQAFGQLGAQHGAYVLLLVSDTGVGMDEVTRARAFEPFYTTKERGKGTGLGLSTVFGIVTQSGGGIRLESEPGAGATFRIYLPRAEGEVESPRPAATDRDLPGGTETILLVEDEDQVRAVAGSILRSAGYQVLAARSAAEALLLVESHAGRIDLLLTDVVMPKMTGRQLAERVLAIRPGIRVLFMSGYTDDVMLQHGIPDSGIWLLPKPLTPSALTRRVRQAIDSNPSPALGDLRDAA